MASHFKIPKKKQPAGSDSDQPHMLSPLSCLQSSAPQSKSGYGDQSSRGRADRVHAGNTFGSPANRQSTPRRPLFRDVVQTLLGLNSPNRGAPAANHRAAAGWSGQSQAAQRAESSSACLLNGWRPKRASDWMLMPDERPSPPQKKRSAAGSAPTMNGISVDSLDSLAEARAEHAGRWSSSAGRASAAGENSASEDDFVSPPRTRIKDARKPSVTPSPRATPDWRRSLDRDDPTEKDRRRWTEFREKKTSDRPAGLQPRLRRPKPTSTDPIVLSSEDEEEEGGGGEGSSRGEETRRGNQKQAPQAAAPSGPSGGFEPPPPSFLQLEFCSLHAGLTHADANGEMMITENGITIPLKGDEEGEVTVVASQVRGYGVWDGGVAQGGTLLSGCTGPAPSLLFLWVTDAQANLLQMELTSIQTSSSASAPSCSFLLLVLKEQLQELQAALLASILDMEEYRRGCSSSPLEWTDGLLLLHSCPPPLDQHLLGLLGCATEKSIQRSRRSGGLQQQLPSRLIQYPAPPCRGRIAVTKEDLARLDAGEFLNDVIIDFYLKYLLLEGVGGPAAERSHVFSSFFYKQLSRRKAAAESDAPSVPDRHMRHQRVKTWTRHVDIFTKDFLFVPVNQEAHWFLVVVCFPGLEDVQHQKVQLPAGGPERAAGNPAVTQKSQQPPDCLQQGCTRDSVTKRPCILVLDSLKLSHHQNVCRLLRDYLQVEWGVRRAAPRVFSSHSVPSCHCRVPLQDNSSDCGVFLLQYAESFLQNPVVHFDLPVRLENWFPRQRVRQKREEIRSLILRLHRRQAAEA